MLLYYHIYGTRALNSREVCFYFITAYICQPRKPGSLQRHGKFPVSHGFDFRTSKTEILTHTVIEKMCDTSLRTKLRKHKRKREFSVKRTDGNCLTTLWLLTNKDLTTDRVDSFNMLRYIMRIYNRYKKYAWLFLS